MAHVTRKGPLFTHCVHDFGDDPWEPGVKRCIYCEALFEDVMPLKLPRHAEPTGSMSSTLVRALRHYPFVKLSGL
jgi:hypothetical protein